MCNNLINWYIIASSRLFGSLLRRSFHVHHWFWNFLASRHHADKRLLETVMIPLNVSIRWRGNPQWLHLGRTLGTSVCAMHHFPPRPTHPHKHIFDICADDILPIRNKQSTSTSAPHWRDLVAFGHSVTTRSHLSHSHKWQLIGLLSLEHLMMRVITHLFVAT